MTKILSIDFLIFYTSPLKTDISFNIDRYGKIIHIKTTPHETDKTLKKGQTLNLDELYINLNESVGQLEISNVAGSHEACPFEIVKCSIEQSA